MVAARGMLALVALGICCWQLRGEVPRPNLSAPSAVAKGQAPAVVHAKSEELSATLADNPKAAADNPAATNDELAKEVDRLLAGPTQGVIPKIVQVARRWGAIDSETALRYFEKLPPRDLRRAAPSRAIIEMWLKSDRRAAAGFVKTAVGRDLGNAGELELVFRDLVLPENLDPYTELRKYLHELPQEEPVFREVFNALMSVPKKNLEATEAFVAELPPGPSRDLAFSTLGAAKARASGFAAVATLTGKSNPSADDRRQLSGAVTALSRQSPGEIARWLETQPVDAAFDYARLRLAVDAHMADPERALQLTRQLSSGSERLRYTGLFLEYWLKKDFAAAQAWATASDLPAELVTGVMTKVTAPKVVVDYEPKLNASLEMTDERLKRRAQYVVQNWLRQDRTAALQWIKANSKTDADEQFFARMIRSVPEHEPLGPAIILE